MWISESVGYFTWQTRINEQLKHKPRRTVSVKLWRQQTRSAVCGTNAAVCVLCTIALICFHTGEAAPAAPPREIKSTTTTTTASQSRALAVWMWMVCSALHSWCVAWVAVVEWAQRPAEVSCHPAPHKLKKEHAVLILSWHTNISLLPSFSTSSQSPCKSSSAIELFTQITSSLLVCMIFPLIRMTIILRFRRIMINCSSHLHQQGNILRHFLC